MTKDESTRGDAEEQAEAGAADASRDEDGAADRVAEALGVDGSEESVNPAIEELLANAAASTAPVSEEAAPKAPANRAERRREAVAERRRKKAEASGTELPKDKNARAKELLQRRREQASEREAAVSSGLLASEMVDDAFTRMTSGAWKWLKKNSATVQGAILAALVVGAGVGVVSWRSEKKAGASSSLLASAVAAEQGRVLADDKRSDEDKEVDPTRVFKSADERAAAALDAYAKAAADEPGSGAAILAKLGESGVLLQKREFAKALEGYAAVLASKLAAADADVKGRALEGSGFAKEGKGDLDGALASFKELGAVDGKGWKELSDYHQGRLLAAKGEKEKAKELLKGVRDKLETPGSDGAKTFKFLEAMVDRKLREVDPTAAPRPAAAAAPGGGPQLTPEQIELLKKQFQKSMQDASKQPKPAGTP